jgi:hypothetical protein
LLRAITKGVFLAFNKLIDSIVCGSRPCIMSTTRIAMSHKEEPLDRCENNDLKNKSTIRKSSCAMQQH